MTSRDFCFWLQGFFDLEAGWTKKEGITSAQADMIKKHLNLVFKHEIDPSMGDEKVQKVLNEIHDSPKKPDPQKCKPVCSHDVKIRC